MALPIPQHGSTAEGFAVPHSAPFNWWEQCTRHSPVGWECPRLWPWGGKSEWRATCTMWLWMSYRYQGHSLGRGKRSSSEDCTLRKSVHGVKSLSQWCHSGPMAGLHYRFVARVHEGSYYAIPGYLTVSRIVAERGSAMVILPDWQLHWWQWKTAKCKASCWTWSSHRVRPRPGQATRGAREWFSGTSL